MKEISRDNSMKRKAKIRAMIMALCLVVMTSMMPVAGMADKVSAADTDVHIEEIDAVDMSFTEPKCGYQGAPAISVKQDAGYAISKTDPGYWYERPVHKNDKKYTGKLKGGKSYYAVIYLEADDSYSFASKPVSGEGYSEYTGSFKVNGKTIKPATKRYYEGSKILALAFNVNIEHTWDSGVITKQPTAQSDGVRTYTCTGCNATRTVAIPKTAAKNGEGGSPVGRGADKVAAEKYILSRAADADMAGTKVAPMMLKAAKRTKKAIVLKWNPVSGASRYGVYGTKCGKKYKMIKLGEVTGTRFNVKKIKRKLQKTYYKFVVVAYDAQGRVLQTTKTVHISPKGNKKKSVYKGVFLKVRAGSKYQNVRSLTLSAGESVKLKYGPVLFKKTKVVRHVKIRFESSDTGVAAVTRKGKITAVKAGTCRIYAYAQNGVGKTLTVNVK